MNLTDIQIVIGVTVIGIIVYKYFMTHKDESGRIEDQSVKISNVLEVIEEFKLKIDSKLAHGYTEKSIQKQLKVHLQKKFVHVVDEYGIEGLNGIKVDFDIGNGAVGLELKLAKEVFKTSNLHRLSGQIDDYMNRKYDDNNFVVAVFGEKQHTSERAYLKQVEEKIEERGAEFAYFEIPSK